jgi:hypothetical protein
MAISVRTRKLLWGKSSMRCAFATCDQPLSLSHEAGSETVVGIECHIVAQKDHPSVARSPSSLTHEERTRYARLIDARDGYDNLILMCGTHAILIDDPAQGYSIENLLELKRDHETSVKASRQATSLGADETRYANLVDGWAARIELERWPAIIEGAFMDGHPRVEAEDFARLGEAVAWIFGRVWPGAIPEIEGAMENFRRVANDFMRVMSAYPHEHLQTRGLVAPNRFYNDMAWSERVGHQRAGELYQYLAYLIEDYALELTRAANLVCAAVRETIDPRFRLEEGLLTMESGPYMDDRGNLFHRNHRPTYDSAGPTWMPYEGLGAFPTGRATRQDRRDDRPIPAELDRIALA